MQICAHDPPFSLGISLETSVSASLGWLPMDGMSMGQNQVFGMVSPKRCCHDDVHRLGDYYFSISYFVHQICASWFGYHFHVVYLYNCWTLSINQWSCTVWCTYTPLGGAAWATASTQWSSDSYSFDRCGVVSSLLHEDLWLRLVGWGPCIWKQKQDLEVNNLFIGIIFVRTLICWVATNLGF